MCSVYKFSMLLFLLLTLTFGHILSSDLLASEQQTPGSRGKPSEHTVLSKEAHKLLEHLKTEIAAYNAKLTSGEIEFSITMSGPKIVGFVNSKRTENMQRDPKGEPTQQKFEVNKHWHIVCRFKGARKFYHIKEHIKTNSDGVPIANSQVTHIEIEVNGNKRQGRQNTGTGWQPIRPHKMPQVPLFKSEFHPGWWGWAPLGYKLSDFLRKFPPIDVQRVKTEKGIRYVITSNDISSYHNRTHKIWIDSQKGYRVTRILTHSKSTWIELNAPPGNSATPLVIKNDPSATSKMSKRDYYTYQIAQFETGIWFPQNATLERFVDTDESQKSQQPYRKITMQVHKAVFNIPIDEKDLRFSD